MSSDSTDIVLLSNGVICVRKTVLPSIVFVHFHSQFEALLPREEKSDWKNIETGSTEWISVNTPTISVGWDWKLKWHAGSQRLDRLDSYRSNLRIVDEHDVEVDVLTAEAMLTTVFRQCSWESIVIGALGLLTNNHHGSTST